MILQLLFGRSEVRDKAGALYVAAVRQARTPTFYTDFGVADVVEGRFEMIVLHVYLVLRGLRRLGPNGHRLGQALMDTLFDDMDLNLREMGIGDLGVGKRVKKMAQGFYGRSKAYEEALGEGAAPDALPAALARNIYGKESVEPATLTALAAYVRAAGQALESQDEASLIAGALAFPLLPAGAIRG